MVRVAVEINEVKRQHEQIVRVMELQTRLVPRYVAADLAALGQLVLEVHRLVFHTERPPSASDGAADTPRLVPRYVAADLAALGQLVLEVYTGWVEKVSC